MEVSFQYHTPATLSQGVIKTTPIDVEDEWAPEMVWKIRITEKSLPLPVLEPVPFVP